MKMTTFSVLVLLACMVGWVGSTAISERREPAPAPPRIQPIGAVTDEGLVRSVEDIGREEDIPTGCSVSATQDSDTDYNTVTCDSRTAIDAEYNSAKKSWWWKDGNCCCPAYRYLSCPKQILVGSTWYTVAHFGTGSQCWVEAYCGLRGLCPTRCQSLTSTRTVLVHDNGEIRWVHYRYSAGCRCTTCSGGYCKGNLNGVSILG